MMDGKLIEGQVYRWQYRNGVNGNYWCKSRIAIVKIGRLIDTYWTDMSSDHEIRIQDVELTLLCDTSWTVIEAWQAPYYDPADIADTRHANHRSAAIYLRPGAQRSAAAILMAIERSEETSNSQVRMAQARLDQMEMARLLLASGRITEVSL